MDQNFCVACKKYADVKVSVIKAMEIIDNVDCKLTLTGTRTTRSYVYPVVYEVKAGICRECIKKSNIFDYLITAFVVTFTTGFLGFLFSMIILFILNNKPDIIIKYVFIGGYSIAMFFMSAIVIISYLEEKNKNRSNPELNLAARSICNYLNKGRKPNSYRYFSLNVWETMQETGKHPHSF